jgi:hypothetical protein
LPSTICSDAVSAGIGPFTRELSFEVTGVSAHRVPAARRSLLAQRLLDPASDQRSGRIDGPIRPRKIELSTAT